MVQNTRDTIQLVAEKFTHKLPNRTIPKLNDLIVLFERVVPFGKTVPTYVHMLCVVMHFIGRSGGGDVLFGVVLFVKTVAKP